jgi:hypothetical protein
MAVQVGKDQFRGRLPVAYGRHYATGQFVLKRFEDGNYFVLHLLGVGEWDACLDLTYAGLTLPSADWRFRPGKRASSLSDPVQTPPEFFPDDVPFNFSEVAYVEARIPETTIKVDNTPGKLIGLFRGLKVWDYDEDGDDLSGSFAYGENPALHAADLLRRYLSYPEEPDYWRERVDWPSLLAFRDWAAETLANGNPRFRSNPVFDRLDLAAALDYIAYTSATSWQDDGSKIRWLLPNRDAATKHFYFDDTGANVLQGSFRRVKLRNQTPNTIATTFREYGVEAGEKNIYVEQSQLLLEADAVIEEQSPALGVLPLGQANRILNARLQQAQATVGYQFSVTGEGLHVARGDLVEVSFAPLQVERQLCEVAEWSKEENAISMLCAPWNPDAYSDAYDEVSVESAGWLAPRNLTVAPVAGSGATLNWERVAMNNTGVEVWRNGRRIASLAGDATTYDDTGLRPSERYHYAVRNVWSGPPRAVSPFAEALGFSGAAILDLPAGDLVAFSYEASGALIGLPGPVTCQFQIHVPTFPIPISPSIAIVVYIDHPDFEDGLALGQISHLTAADQGAVLDGAGGNPAVGFGIYDVFVRTEYRHLPGQPRVIGDGTATIEQPLLS